MRDTGRPSNLLFRNVSGRDQAQHGRQAAGKALSCTLTDRYSVRASSFQPLGCAQVQQP